MAPAIRGLRGRTVLVAEDQWFVADDLAAALRGVGARVAGPAASLSDALRLLHAGPVDLAVLDVDLGGEPCFPLADALAARGVPFLFATGYDRAFIPGRFHGAPHWEKPFDTDALARALARLPRPAALSRGSA